MQRKCGQVHAADMSLEQIFVSEYFFPGSVPSEVCFWISNASFALTNAQTSRAGSSPVMSWFVLSLVH